MSRKYKIHNPEEIYFVNFVLGYGYKLVPARNSNIKTKI